MKYTNNLTEQFYQTYINSKNTEYNVINKDFNYMEMDQLYKKIFIKTQEKYKLFPDVI